MRHRLIYLIILISIKVCGQQVFENDFVNKKSKQWLHYTGCSNSGHGHYNFFTLVSKNNLSDNKEIKISGDKFDSFVDSLKKVGFKATAKLVDKIKLYKTAIELVSIKFYEMEDQDSVFSFVYRITLTSIKTNKPQTTIGYRHGNEKNKVLDAFRTSDYIFDSVAEIKGTSIIRVGLLSEKLLFPDKGHQSYVFAPWTCYYF